ncbi:MAG TPA: hypothetical protein VFS09_00010 [Candidatus Eisenbacteria bacterium]|nr:hypothetical protein [Candidatus Eisenbacteria bacterium]
MSGMRRARIAGVGAASLLALLLGFALLASGCDSPRRPKASRPKPLAADVAAALADSLRGVLVEHFEVPATSTKDAYALPSDGDSIPGYVVRVSVPYEMVSKHSIPHEWLRERLLDNDWTIYMAADASDGASYRAVRGPAEITVEAIWEDTHPPADVPDWYAMTVGIPSKSEGR